MIFTSRNKKVVHSLAPALILTLALTLSLNHLANKLLQMIGSLYGLKYSRLGNFHAENNLRENFSWC